MSFPQTSISTRSGSGIPGDKYLDAPTRAQSFFLNSVEASYNVIGATAYTHNGQTSDGLSGVAAAGNVGGTGVFAGILVNSKTYPSFGTQSGGPLAPTMTLPNGIQGELATEGSFFASLPAAANIGDLVIYDNTTGALATIAPSASLPSGKSFAYAFVDYYAISGAGTAVITLEPTLRIPT